MEEKGAGAETYNALRRGAWRFVVAIGVVSLFADMTYEGARSIVGPWLATFGASAFLVGVIGGGGEFLGYAVRWFAGRGADRSGRHWIFIYIGYALNLIVVPCLALTASLGAAAGLVVSERFGKGIRTPPRDALLARAGESVGHGAGFGLHEFLDQLGALVGPLVVAGLVFLAGYRAGFAVLAVPAVAALAALVVAQRFQVRPQVARTSVPAPLPRAFWQWLAFAALATAGFAHFTLIAFHLATRGHMTPALIPVLFAVAMASEGLAGLLLGRLSDRMGAWLLAVFPLSGLAGAILLFLLPAAGRWLGAVVWGAGLGVQAVLLRAQVARTVGEGRRGEAFGLLDTAMGASWFAGSMILGALYGLAPAALVIGAIVLEAAALVWLAGMRWLPRIA